MPERSLPPEEGLRRAIGRASFLLSHRDAVRSLMHGKLFDRVPGSRARREKEWRNVAEHCVDVARALDYLADALGLTDEERASIVNVGFVHDWNKRLAKDPGAFTEEEKRSAKEHTASFLAAHDPHGHLLDATEPRGLARLEGGDARLTEHLVHLVDLSCMHGGFAPPEKRIDDIVGRRKKEGVDHDAEYPRFWERKRALALREERQVLDMLRARGVAADDGARLCDLLDAALDGRS